jgi:hypothetical protein
MAGVKISWVLPTVRKSGKPLAVADIAKVTIEGSADGGANYAVIGEFPPAVLESTLPEIDPGLWTFRGTVFDTNGRLSDPVVSSIDVPDTTAPAALVLNLALT